LMNQRGWTWAKKIAGRETKLTRMLKLMKGQKKAAAKFKFGVEVPPTANVAKAMELDRANGDNKWFEAQQYEANSLMNMGTFEIPPDDFDLEANGYQYVPCIYAWDVKYDGRRRARMVANGARVVGLPPEDIWSGVVSIDAVRSIMFLAALNDMQIVATDISSAYLMADTKEKMYTKLGKEFGPMAGCKEFHKHLSKHLAAMGFSPSKADSEVWMRDCGTHYEYVAKYIDDIIVVSYDARNLLVLMN